MQKLPFENLNQNPLRKASSCAQSFRTHSGTPRDDYISTFKITLHFSIAYSLIFLSFYCDHLFQDEFVCVHLCVCVHALYQSVNFVYSSLSEIYIQEVLQWKKYFCKVAKIYVSWQRKHWKPYTVTSLWPHNSTRERWKCLLLERLLVGWVGSSLQKKTIILRKYHSEY